jgi:hypothetical protein
VRALPTLNHLLQTCLARNIDEYGRIEETFAPSALELIADWISRHCQIAAAGRSRQSFGEIAKFQAGDSGHAGGEFAC